MKIESDDTWMHMLLAGGPSLCGVIGTNGVERKR